MMIHTGAAPPEMMAITKEMESVVEAKSKYQEFLSDVPSFSLGMTQILGEMGSNVAYNAEETNNEDITPTSRATTILRRHRERIKEGRRWWTLMFGDRLVESDGGEREVGNAWDGSTSLGID
ncbi:hypothetical protein DM860_002145 [Cuscuta australis]|uniref:Uncharacterized protein n=1 Tax=Cuscuta australis TaxID=267555 RepID=A0A328DVW1_9ASTE|nr:hypothetical protein DM860_002145 [Cuscuta australis]